MVDQMIPYEERMVHIRFEGQSWDIAFSVLDIGDLSRDQEVRQALARYLDAPIRKLSRYAVERQLMVIGEAVKRLSPEFRASHSGIPWSAIAGMRDHLIHGYDIVDLEEVWKTATVDVPDLLTALEPLVPPQE